MIAFALFIQEQLEKKEKKVIINLIFALNFSCN